MSNLLATMAVWSNFLYCRDLFHYQVYLLFLIAVDVKQSKATVDENLEKTDNVEKTSFPSTKSQLESAKNKPEGMIERLMGIKKTK